MELVAYFLFFIFLFFEPMPCTKFYVRSFTYVVSFRSY